MKTLVRNIKGFEKQNWKNNGALLSFFDNKKPDSSVIVFLHAFPFNKDMWKNQLEYFEDRFRLIAYDIRGFGSSSLGNKSLSMDLFVQDLKLFLEKLGLKKVILCGLSLGGYIALNFYKQQSTFVKALILCNTQCREDSKLEITQHYKTVDEIIGYGLDYFGESLMPRLLSKEKHSLTGNLMKTVRQNRKEAVAFTLLSLAKREDTCGFLPRIKVPTLVMVGEDDLITPIKEAVYLHEHIHSSKLEIINGAGHLSSLENPAAFNSTMDKFLKEFKFG